jgi:quinol monooxygenase YgiN
MYGTVAKLKVKPGHIGNVIALAEEWDRDFAPRIKGAVGGISYKLDSDPNTLIMCAIFESKDAYFKNADNPDQDKWFQRMRENLAVDPEWNDGEILYAHTNKAL